MPPCRFDHAVEITSRCGPGRVDELNKGLLAKAAESKLVGLDRLWADSSVAEANVAYPTDGGLLAKGVVTLGTRVAALRAAGLRLGCPRPQQPRAHRPHRRSRSPSTGPTSGCPKARPGTDPAHSGGLTRLLPARPYDGPEWTQTVAKSS